MTPIFLALFFKLKLNMCKAKVTAKTCYFYNNLESLFDF